MLPDHLDLSPTNRTVAVDIDTHQNAAAASHTVKAAAALARHAAFDAMYDNCSAPGCGYNQMARMHATTQQLQSAMDQLQHHYLSRQFAVPARIQARAATIAQGTAHVGALTAEAQKLRARETAPTEMLLEGVRIVGQLTQGALTAAEDATIMHKNRKWPNHHHASFKIKLLRQGGQCSGQQPFFMC